MSGEHNSRITWLTERASKAASVVVIVTALLVLVGWMLDIPILRSFFPGQTSMRPNSALTYILAGLALWILQEEREGTASGQRLRKWGKALALVVIASGALTFSEYVFGPSLGIDQLLFRDTEVPVPGLFPGRMTPTGALSFVFFGSGLLLLDWKKRRGSQPAEFLAFAVILDGMFGVLDYVLHPGVSLTGIAVNSALLSWVLGGGLLTARANHQVRRFLASEFFAGAVYRRLIPAAVVIPTVLAMLMWWGQRAGFLDGQVGLTLLVVMVITTLVFIVTWTTESLDETDQGRRAAAMELDVRVQQQAAIVELGQQALTGIDLSTLMKEAVRLVARTLSVEYCKVQELLPGGQALVLRAGVGWKEELVGHATVGVEPDSQAGYVLRSDTPVIVEDLRNDSRFSGSPLLSEQGVVSGLSVIISGKERPFGVLGAHTSRRRSFTKDDVNFLQAVANVLATAIERKRGEEALRQSEERFRQMAENIREVLWMVDATGTKVLYVSPSYKDVWGRSPESIFGHGHKWLDAIHPEDRRRVRTALGGDIPQREFELEFRVVWPDGSVHWIRDRSFPVRDPSGQVERIVGISEDITERRLAAEALLESEERYRQLFNEMNVGCALLEVICDQHGTPTDARFVDVNPTFEYLTGYTKESVSEKRVLEVFPEIQPHWVERLGRVALTGESVHFEGYSQVFNKHFAVTAFRPRHGRFAIVFADITERKQAQQALEGAERKYHSIFENAMEGIFQVREDGGLLTANPAMANLLGYQTSEEFIREVRNIEQHWYIEPRHPSGFIPLLKQQGAIAGFETQMRRKDGTLIWVMGSAYAVRDEGGRVLYYEGTLRDITEHKKAEEALRQLSSQLLHAQDDERRRIARELHDSTGQYLAGVAMNLSWMNQSPVAVDTETQKVIRESIDLVKRCSSEIRNFSYLLHPPVLDEYGLLAALRWYVQGFSTRSGIRVDLDVPDDLPRLTRHAETALFRVVQECLTNVHRHSGSSRAEIHLHQESGSLTLQVSDTGHGITPLSPEKGGGSARVGVGIAGIRERMRELGGRLEIHSDQCGTTVTASLPVGLEEVA
jgi:PAS domain S-box-containing protein